MPERAISAAARAGELFAHDGREAQQAVLLARVDLQGAVAALGQHRSCVGGADGQPERRAKRRRGATDQDPAKALTGPTGRAASSRCQASSSTRKKARPVSA